MSFYARPIATKNGRRVMKRIFPKLAAVAIVLAMCLGAPVVYANRPIMDPGPDNGHDKKKMEGEGGHKTIPPTPVCPVHITQPGNYDLAGPVGPCPTGVNGIDIEASDVTLHLNGFSINQSTPCTGDGIHVENQANPAAMLSEVHVLGPGMINDFSSGLMSKNAADSFVKQVMATCQTGRGHGFRITSRGGRWKIQGNVFRNGTPQQFCAITLFTDDNDVIGNDLNDPICFDGNNNTIVNNTSSGGDAGMEGFSGSINNEIHANTTDNNIFFGISIDAGSTGNNITGNESSNNHPDMEDDNPNCDSNKWEGNHFNTASQTCIH